MAQPKPKIAEWAVAAIYLTCPYCGGDVRSAYDGSLMVVAEDYTMRDAGWTPPILECNDCGRQVQAPKWPERRQKRKAS